MFKKTYRKISKKWVTENFKVSEFDCKDGTPYPQEWIESRLKVLCDMLEIIRAEWGKPVTCTSGYRTESYNKKVGGVKKSQHVQGLAVDIKIEGVSARKVARRIDEMIREGRLPNIKGLGSYNSFTHIDCRDSNRLIKWGFK